MEIDAQIQPGVIEELRRRKVLRSTTLYAVTSWCLLQWCDLLSARYGFPEWSVSLLLGAIVLGFPVVVALSWAFDVTPEGVRRADPGESPVLTSKAVSRGLNMAAVLLVAATVAMLVM